MASGPADPGASGKSAVQRPRSSIFKNHHPKASSSWAAVIKQVHELNPLECPRCKGTRRIIAFLEDSAEIKKIMPSLRLPDFKAPAPLKTGPPEQDDLWPNHFQDS